ncbi:MAG: InlB B-repeat-containing protein [Treponema sp.]|nr:InlB B-repeat-containing protein [Candidatus Treponema equifaecale]
MNKNITKFLGGILSVLMMLALGFTGCSTSTGSRGSIDDEEETPKYTVTFDLNGGTGENFSEKVEENTTVSKPSKDPIKSHFVFTDWYKDREGTAIFNFDEKITADITVYAIYKKDMHTVTFDLNGGSGTAPEEMAEIECGSEIELPATTGFAKENATCLGWATSSDAESGLSGKVTVSGDVTYYLVWTDRTTFDVTFNVDGTTYNTAKVVDGKTVTAPTDPVKEGYKFKEWQLNGTAYNFETAVTSAIELTAAWEAVEEDDDETSNDEKYGDVSIEIEIEE